MSPEKRSPEAESGVGNCGPAMAAPTGPPKRRLLDQVRDKLRVLHYSKRTEEAYVDWIRRFILHHNKRHPAEMGAKEVEQFLTYLAVQLNVAASTQNQALSAILFLYRHRSTKSAASCSRCQPPRLS